MPEETRGVQAQASARGTSSEAPERNEKVTFIKEAIVGTAQIWEAAVAR